MDANQRLSHDEEGKAYGRKAKTSNRTGEIPPSGIIGGASENVTLVEMCSHLATERAGMGTLHLTVGASELYPNLHFHCAKWSCVGSSDSLRHDIGIGTDWPVKRRYRKVVEAAVSVSGTGLSPSAHQITVPNE